MQTILGSTGAIGTAIAKILPDYTDEPIRLVSRNPQKVHDNNQLFPADVLKKDELSRAMAGSSVVYITVGFAYDTKTWQTVWPSFMENVIDIAIAQKCKLVFFDNVYMYDRDYLNSMDEKTPVNPTSKKGLVRKTIAKMLTDKMATKELTAIIARSADFYGPNIKQNSMLTELLFKPLSKVKKANILLSADHVHSFSFVPDIARAVAMLGNTDSAYNQIWHLPTAANPLTMEEWVDLVAEEFGVKPRYQVLPTFLLSILAVFMPIMREIKEMGYQFDRDYRLDSSKFEKAFDFTPTPYREGVKQVINEEFKKRGTRPF